MKTLARFPPRAGTGHGCSDEDIVMGYSALPVAKFNRWCEWLRRFQEVAEGPGKTTEKEGGIDREGPILKDRRIRASDESGRTKRTG